MQVARLSRSQAERRKLRWRQWAGLTLEVGAPVTWSENAAPQGQVADLAARIAKVYPQMPASRGEIRDHLAHTGRWGTHGE
jgi:hypothetical protein